MFKSHVATGAVRPLIKKTIGLGLACLMGTSVSAVAGKKLEIDNDRWLNVGVGMRTSLSSVEDGSASGDKRGNNFDVESVRLYLSGQVHENIKFTLNTEEIAGDVEILDALVQFEFAPTFNLWMGKMLTPADRIEMNGPYYGLTWNQYTQPLFPSDQGGAAGRYGRDDGVTVWGAVEKFQYAVGIFDGLQGLSNVDDEMLVAARFAYNFLNQEKNPGYYTSGTYYGGLGNILTLGFSYQNQNGGTGTATTSGDFTGFALDLLSETVLSGGAVLTVEAEYKDFDADYSLATIPEDFVEFLNPCFCLFDGESMFGAIAFLLPHQIGPGKLQPYLRLVSNEPSDSEDSDLTEVGVNYVISGHNARLNFNYGDGDANLLGYQGFDTNYFSFGAQIQL